VCADVFSASLQLVGLGELVKWPLKGCVCMKYMHIADSLDIVELAVYFSFI